jgi:hypothetical protein
LKNKDVTIIYQGASGGFLLFYYILLTGRYHSGIRNLYSVSELINLQFNSNLINRRSDWKNCEFWPDNYWAKENQESPRLFLICNPFFNPEVDRSNRQIADSTYKILLYTDIKLQIRMAWEKRAWWFTSITRNVYQKGTEREYIRWILSQGEYDPAIENIISIYKPDLFLRLETFIQDPVLSFLDQPSDEQLNFIQHWINLQSEKSQKLLYRTINSGL